MHSRVAAVLAGSMMVLFPPRAGAQDAPPTVIRAARMIELPSGRLIEHAVVVVTGDRITAVNPASPPANAKVIDLGDVTLLPGFIDLHTHLVGEISAASFFAAVTQTDADAAFSSVAYAGKTIRAGFTTVRDFGGDITVALGKAVDKGTITGPRVVPSRNSHRDHRRAL